VVQLCDEGKPVVWHHRESAAAKAFQEIARIVVSQVEDRSTESKPLKKGGTRK